MSSTLNRLQVGIVGIEPGIVLLATSEQESVVFAPGFINQLESVGNVTINKGDFIFIRYDEGDKQELAIPEIGAGGIITLLPVAGDFNAGGPIEGGQNVGGGNESFLDVSGNLMRFRTLIAGANVTITQNANDLTIAAADPGTGTITNGQNLGTGQNVFAQVSGANMQFKSLIAGANVTLGTTSSDITINATGSGGGTITDGVNLGAGNHVFNSASGANLQFNTLVSGDNVTIVPSGNTLVISATSGGGGGGDISNAVNLGSGTGVFAQKVSPNLQFKSLVAGPNVSLSNDSNTVTISALGSDGFIFTNTIFVAKGGNDANDGHSINSAKLTIEGALASIVGDAPTTINIMDNGTYAEHTAIGPGNNIRIIAPAAVLTASIPGEQALFVAGPSTNVYLNFRQITTGSFPSSNQILYITEDAIVNVDVDYLQGGFNTDTESTGCSVSGFINNILGDFGESGNEFIGHMDLVFNDMSGSIFSKNSNIKLNGNALNGNIGLIGTTTNSALLTGTVASVSSGFTITASSVPNAHYNGLFGSYLYSSGTSGSFSDFDMKGNSVLDRIDRTVLVTTNFIPAVTDSNTLFLFDSASNAQCQLPIYAVNPNFPIGYTVSVCQRQAGNVNFTSGDIIESVNNRTWTEGRGSVVTAKVIKIGPNPMAPDQTAYSWSLSGQIAGSAITTDTFNVYVSALIGDDTTGLGSITQPYATIGAAITAAGTPTNRINIVILDDETYAENVTISNQYINLIGRNAAIIPASGDALTISTTIVGSAVHDIQLGTLSASSGIALVSNTSSGVVTNLVLDKLFSDSPIEHGQGSLFINAASINCDKTITDDGNMYYVSARNQGVNTEAGGTISGISPEGTSTANFRFLHDANVLGTLTISNNYDMPTAAGSLGDVITNNGDGTSSWLPGGGGSGISWSGIAGTSQAAAVNKGYVIQNASATTITLPATAALGSIVYVQGLGAAGWILTANTGQTIQVGSTATSSGGTVTSANQWDAIGVVCVVANTTWAMLPPVTSGFTIA